MILTVATTKGGAGKTTLCRLLLARLTAQGLSLAAIDTDINHTLADWLTLPKAPKATGHHTTDESRMVSLARDLETTHDVVVIDTAGAVSTAMFYAFGISDLVLIPLQPSLGDIVEAVKTFRHIASAEAVVRRKLLARVVLLSAKDTTAVGKHVLAAADEAKLPLMQTRLSHLVAYQEMSFNGVAPTKAKAGREVDAFFEELAALRVLPQPSKLASEVTVNVQERPAAR